MQTFRDRLVDAFQAARVNRARQNDGRNRQQGTVQQGFTHVCVEDGRDSSWARVRRQEAMGYRERGSHRHTDVQQRNTRVGGNGEDQRQQQHEAHFVEQREADGETGQYDRPLNVFATKFVDKRGGNTLRAAAVGQHFTEHGAKAHNQRQAAKGAANAVFNRHDDFVQRHALH